MNLENSLLKRAHEKCELSSANSKLNLYSILPSISAVQIMAWRMLKKLSDHDWARDLLDQLFLDDESLKYAKRGTLVKNISLLPIMNILKDGLMEHILYC
jgi:hypothetical protein